MTLFKRFVTGLGASLGWLFLLLIIGFGILHWARSSNLNGVSTFAGWVGSHAQPY
jgi:hypothetical protein